MWLRTINFKRIVVLCFIAIVAITSLPLSHAEGRSLGRITLGFSPSCVRFAVIGDYGIEGQPELDVANLVKSWNPDFIITTGDNNYPNGAASTIDQNIGQYYHDFIYPYTGIYGAGSLINRFFPSLGNHDWYTENAQPYLDYFDLPNNERYYDFIWGPVHLFALDSDSNEPDGISSTSNQAMWLENALSNSTYPWKIVYFHHAPYSSGPHGSTIELQWPFESWGATAVLAGHDHTYERLVIDGFPYFVNGLGGHTIYGFNSPLPGSQVRYNEDYGAMMVEANPYRLTFQFVSRTGSVIDAYTIHSGLPEDFDGDGVSDIGFFRGTESGLWGILKSTDTFDFNNALWFSWGQDGDLPVLGDYDGDGMTDPAVRRPPVGGQSAAILALLSSTGYDYGQALIIPAGWPSLSDTPVPADFDGDGITDPAIWRESQGVWIIPLSGGNYSTYTFASWGVSGDSPVGADVDGDGIADIGFYRASSGLWGFLKSSTGYSLGDPVWFSWGGATDTPMMDDYDGDGLADPAFVTPPAGGQSAAYRILLSSTGYDYGQALTIPAGWPSLGDMPIPADVDGDGKADPGIWRESSGVWIIAKSSCSYSCYLFNLWGQSGDIAVPNRPWLE